MTSSVVGVRVGAQRPRLSSFPARRRGSCGRDAVEFAADCGLVLDDWQAWCLDGLLSEDEERRLCASLVLLILPRQNGKNSVLEAFELYGLYVLGWQRILHTAHLQETSADHMARMRALIEDVPSLDKITHFYAANGKERIQRTDTRASIRFMTRSKKIGRGGSPNAIIFDEALFLTKEQVQSIVPSISAQTMNTDAPIMVYTSSAPVAESDVLHTVRNACVTGKMPSAFYAEWGCEVGTEVDDLDALYASNPGMGVRISPDWVYETELTMLGEGAFLIERLGVVAGADAAPSELPRWHECFDPRSLIEGSYAIGVDVAPDLAWSTVAVAGRRPDGLGHLEIVERLAGTASIVPLLVKLCAAEGLPVWLDPRSSAAGLAPRLVEAGVKVIEVSSHDYVRACEVLRQSVEERLVRHRGGLELNQAVQLAATRPVGDSWVWARRTSSVDISPLVAVTLAWAAIMGDTTTPVFAY